MTTFTADGKGHACLRRLTLGPATREELSHLRRMTPSKCWHLLGAMIADGLVFRSKDIYSITDKGLMALEVMDAGQDYTVHEGTPNARVFA